MNKEKGTAPGLGSFYMHAVKYLPVWHRRVPAHRQHPRFYLSKDLFSSQTKKCDGRWILLEILWFNKTRIFYLVLFGAFCRGHQLFCMSQPKGLRKRRLVDLASRQSHSEFLLMSLSPNLCCLLPLSEEGGCVYRHLHSGSERGKRARKSLWRFRHQSWAQGPPSVRIPARS